MILNILDWLKNKEYDYTWDVSLNGNKPDLIAFKEKEIITFEFKKYAEEIPNAINQCLNYLVYSNQVFVVLPKDEITHISKKSFSLLKKHGVGLIEVNKNIKVFLEPKYQSKDNITFIQKLKIKNLREDVSFITSKGPNRNLKEKILEVLTAYPEGLHIKQIAELVKAHRHTATKYIHELIGAGIVDQREIGPVKLCFLKEKFVEPIKEKEILEKIKRLKR